MDKITTILNNNPVENLPDTITDLLTLPTTLVTNPQNLTLLTEINSQSNANVHNLPRPQTVYKIGSHYTDHMQPFKPHPGISVTNESAFDNDDSQQIAPIPSHGYPPESIPQNCTLPSHHYPNPFASAIDSFDCTPFASLPLPPPSPFPIPPSHISPRTSQLNSSSYTYISSPSQLPLLTSQLNLATSISFDVEHNSLLSFSGLTCLIQLSLTSPSSPPTNYLLDVFPLWSYIGPTLSPSFSSPSILKICHGGPNDILWLQRDFGVYCVNLFDTFLAVRILGFERKSLKYLIERYVEYKVDKRYQMEDWRVRPLGEGMRSYAVGDVYFLKYCYERLRHDLGVERVKEVFEGSKEVAKGRFMIKIRQEGGMEGLRERVAREEDVSGMMVLSENEMRRLKEHRPKKEADLKRLLRHDNVLAWQHRAEIIKFFVEEGGASNVNKAATSVNAAQPPQPQPSLMANRNNLHSPVLTTETLYLTAGWITPNQFDEEGTDKPSSSHRASPVALPPSAQKFEEEYSVGVPKSVEEIYVRSNRSRRKKVEDLNDEDDNAEELPEGYLPERKKGNKGEGGEEYKQNIMESVGWVGKGETEWKT
ncbi:hypothetical protein TrVE_jg13217 [Triparma verrucosa]|uniref:3'-5' exonuclease domain-containing protein n=1 Tax=Triparma verrucosa TaxID=1606542 RepID=A0A9W7KWL0_9STRA|nr:hypothetical protein TrVE_jg13217 [Triparma verrucosa]